MTIAVENGLTGIREYLEARGYHVVDIDTYQDAIDAVVYSVKKITDIKLSVSNYAMPPIQSVGFLRDDDYYGILFINAKNKSNEEIEQAIFSKVYTKLF